MARFIYRMQNILNIKMKMEEQAKMDYGNARRKLTEEEEKLSALEMRKKDYEGLNRSLLENQLDLQRIRETKDAILRMDEFIDLQKIEIEKAEKYLEEERQKLQEAIQERKIHEKLRETAFDNFLLEEKARESKEIDELVSYTYGQKNSDT